MGCLECFCDLLYKPIVWLKDNSQEISTIVLAVFAGMQYYVVMKQKNLALLDKRLKLKNYFENHVDDKLKNCLEPKLNIDTFKENYENMTKMAGDAYILFNRDISEKIMNLAQKFEELKTAIHYYLRKNKKK